MAANLVVCCTISSRTVAWVSVSMAWVSNVSPEFSIQSGMCKHKLTPTVVAQEALRGGIRLVFCERGYPNYSIWGFCYLQLPANDTLCPHSVQGGACTECGVVSASSQHLPPSCRPHYQEYMGMRHLTNKYLSSLVLLHQTVIVWPIVTHWPYLICGKCSPHWPPLLIIALHQMVWL